MFNIEREVPGGNWASFLNTVFLCIILIVYGPLSAFAEKEPTNKATANAANSISFGWPVWPDSAWHAIGTTHGTYVCLNEGSLPPVMHAGIDILVPAGTPVYAIKSGYVKYLDMLFPGNELDWCLVIGDSCGTQECNGWGYVHMTRSSISHNVGDTVEQGEFLGNIIEWPQPDWHHLHFGEIHSQGDSLAWNDKSQWRFMSNALDVLVPMSDPAAPVFENALESQLFAFAINNTDSYFTPGAPISGDVDIICKAYDRINHDFIKTAPYQLEYQIMGDSAISWTNSICFTGEILDQTIKWETDIVYQDDATCDTRGDYSVEEFEYYFNVTNTDGDSILETSDKDYCWQTPYFHNGQYTISVRAYDAYGNNVMESMGVSVENYFELSGTILLSNKQGLDQTIVTVASSGQSDTTDEAGYFSIPDVGGGSQLVEIRQGGYEPVDMEVMMSQNQQIELTLNFLYACGDANGDGDANVGDAVFLISYVFKGGSAPDPLEAGDANCDGQVNVGDAVYLIAHIFNGGPAPCCP